MFLALDTATDFPSLALGSPEQPGEEVRLPTRRDLSRDIERLVADLLARRGVALKDLDGVVVADGPGSFTGLRIGIAFAKGLCRAHGLALHTGASLMGAAFRACGGAGSAVAEYDALRGDVFRAAYRFAGAAVEVLSPPALVAAGSLVEIPGAYARAGAADASAAALLALAACAGALTDVGDAAAWAPAYGRLAEAEARRRVSPPLAP